MAQMINGSSVGRRWKNQICRPEAAPENVSAGCETAKKIVRTSRHNAGIMVHFMRKDSRICLWIRVRKYKRVC